MRVGAALAAGLLVVIAVAATIASGGGSSAGPAGPLVTPGNITEDGAPAVGQDDAPVTVTVFFDYMCPFCGRCEAANDGELGRLVEAGTTRLELRPMAFLDRQSAGTQAASPAQATHQRGRS